MNARLNRNLIVLPRVVLTPSIEEKIVFLDAEFAKKGQKAYVISGFRNEAHQLDVIMTYVLAKGILKEFPEVANCRVQDTMAYQSTDPAIKIDTVYKWQPAWSKLLAMGVIINPCRKAMMLFDHNPTGKQNMKGMYYPASAHIAGLAFDIGGGDNGVKDEVEVVEPFVGKPEPGITGIAIERAQNCLHVNCTRVQ